jgi:hypothetical protein
MTCYEDKDANIHVLAGVQAATIREKDGYEEYHLLGYDAV